MVGRAASKSKSDGALQTQSAIENKGKEKWFDNKGKGDYNNSTSRIQQEGDWSNQRKSSYQSNQRDGVACRGSMVVENMTKVIFGVVVPQKMRT